MIKPNLAILVRVHGAGTANRNQSGEGHESFWVLADQLTRRGIAVLRYDKRGIARSSGDYDAHTWQDLSDDVVAIAKHMRKQRVSKNRCDWAGEGSGIAAVSSAQHGESLDFIVDGGCRFARGRHDAVADHATAIANGADNSKQRPSQFARKYYGILVEQEDPTKTTGNDQGISRAIHEKNLSRQIQDESGLHGLRECRQRLYARVIALIAAKTGARSGSGPGTQWHA